MRQAASPAPVRGVRRIIERPRLIKLLDETAARTILLIAPAGYGKTTLARQWVARHQGVRWYAARTGSADIAQLAVEVAETLDDLAPGLASYVSQFVRARPSPAQQATEIVDGFAGAAGEIGTVTIAIDDYHLIAADETAERFVSELQQKLGLRLLIASRLRPRWATARLEIYGDSLELGQEELALTDDEACDVLGATQRDVPTLLERAKGWPAVVGLASQAGREFASPPDGAASTLFRFFAEELFLATPAKLQEKLITLALLPSLSEPFVDSALGEDSQSVIAEAIESGLATQGPESAELHPLVREYLFTKLRGREDAFQRVEAAFRASLDGEFWDHAFELVERFDATELLDPLIERSFKPLLSSGRIATLDRVAKLAHTSEPGASPLTELVAAELAFRSGFFARAESIAARVASGLPSGHRFASHAWAIAGQGAQLTFEDTRARRHFELAREMALSDDDLREALWGLVITSCQAESSLAYECVEQLLARRERSAVDCVRATAAEIHLDRVFGSRQAIRLEEALHAVRHVGDPRIRTSFLNACAYYSILAGEYDRAAELADQLRETADDYQLVWARPHAYWTLAASAFGKREFGSANSWLRKAEQTTGKVAFGPLLLNASCLRSRILLALQRPEDALSALTVDETVPVNRGMRAEFLATKAMALAVLGRTEESDALACDARAMTGCVEARAYVACTRAISAQQVGEDPVKVKNIFSEVVELAAWDAFVAAVRAWPELLRTLIAAAPVEPAVVAALRRSRDFDLAKQADLELGKRSAGTTGGSLTPRETEVLELVRQGLTNSDIARILFISRSTVKVHVRHILDKTGSRTRTEAATSEKADT